MWIESFCTFHVLLAPCMSIVQLFENAHYLSGRHTRMICRRSHKTKEDNPRWNTNGSIPALNIHNKFSKCKPDGRVKRFLRPLAPSDSISPEVRLRTLRKYIACQSFALSAVPSITGLVGFGLRTMLMAIAPMMPSAPPNMKGAWTPTFCHNRPAIKLAGNTIIPTLPL
jgi:hypothetical protein